MSRVKQVTIASVCIEIVENPSNYFERLEKMVFEARRGLYGAAWIGFFSREDEATQLPAADTAFFRKIVARKGEYTTNGFILTQNPITITIINALFGSIDPNKLDAPNDGHLCWQAAAPPTDKLMGYVHDEGYTIEIDPSALKLDSHAIDMQCVTTRIGYPVHILTKKGTVYHAIFTPRDIRTNTYPEFKVVTTGVNAILTVPRDGEAIPFYGTDRGIIVNGDILLGTQGMKVKMIVLDTGRNRMFFKTDDNKIYALKLDRNFKVQGKPIQVNDNATETMTYDWILSGPALYADPQNPVIMLSGWNKSSDGRQYTHVRKLLPISAQILE